MHLSRTNVMPLALAVALLTSSPASAEWDRRGNLSVQAQAFTDNAIHSADQSFNLSVSGSAEFNRSIGENGNLTVSPFFRLDQHDDERTHFDLRELLYRYSADTWELSAGLGKVFWGVTESSNIVDVINQKDAVEGIDPEHKLGQPMINLLLLKDWGEISLFVLPGFRERTYAGVDGRPRGLLPINTDDATYEASEEEGHVDFAARVSGAVDVWDIGVHAFHGTSREPVIQFPSLAPFYYQMNQVGLDVQATLESWLLKSEAIYQTADAVEDHSRFTNGFEYSFYDVSESGIDVGIVAEWMYDDREELADHPFQNDLLFGVRLALNDEQSTDALIGVIADLDDGGDIFTIEASRRLGDTFKLTFNAAIWANANDDFFLSQFQQEDYLQLELGYFF